MPLITETYYLSLTQDNRGILRLRCSQDDTLRTVNLKLYNNGSIFVISSGVSASISGVKQNGAVFSKPCTISQDRESVVLQLSSDITNVDGVIIAEIVLNDGNGDRLGTSNFIIQVEKNPIRAGIIQDTETPIEYVNDFITQIQALTARVNNLITPNGDPSLAEVVDARISSLDGNTYQNLKARIDADVATLNTRKANKSEVYTKSQVDDLLANVEIDVDDELSDESENPVQNKVVAGAISEIKADLGDLSDLETESTTDLVSAINEVSKKGLSDEAKAALLACFNHVVWHGERDDYYNNLRRTLFGEDPFYNIWEWSSQATGVGALTKMPAGCSESLVDGTKGIFYNNTPTNIQNNKRRSFLVAKGKATVKAAGDEVAYYPIPIPKTATKATVTITPSSQQIGVYIFKLGDIVSSDGYYYDTYPQTPATSWTTGECVVEFAASEDLFLALQCRVSASGAYSSTTEPDLTIVFE